MAKTTLDKTMETQGWIKYTHVERGGAFGTDTHDRDLIETLTAHKITFLITHDLELPDNSVNSLYVLRRDFEKVCSLFY